MSSAEPFVPEPGDARLTAAMLSDALDEVGLRHQVLSARLAPIVAGSRILGRATTVQFAPSTEYDPEDPYGDAIDFIDSVRPGEVVVVATDASNASGFWGELFSAAAKGRGAAGVVTDGNARDVQKIAAVGFPAFAAGYRPIDFRGRMRVVARDAPVTVGGVEIAPGDLVLADDDGVVVVPRAQEDEVLAAARRRAASESSVLTELLAGSTIREVWERHRVL
ncbi:RraA family protein [Demequina maris]|uniref:RraA family protein n=1 Tax=Demequina maris TaxID=1638982 RepID=UPI000784F10E|nr:dimethylmenaquinone methyltransferase [Demequina maris]